MRRVANSFGQSIEQAVRTVKMNPAKRRDFMDLEMKLADARNEGSHLATLNDAEKVIYRYRKLNASNDFIRGAIKSDFGDSLTKEEIAYLLSDLK